MMFYIQQLLHIKNDNFNLIEMKEVGHCANIDKPLEFNRIVKEIIEENK